MKTIYALRHQHGGVYTGVLFTREPTPEQIAPVVAYLDAVHAAHGKGWARVVPVDVCEDEIPVMPATPQERAAASGIAAAGMVVSATGTVG